MNLSKERADQVFGGTFLIGLALLFITGWWWPGVMFVIGAAILVRGVAEGQSLTENRGGLVVIGIGLFFVLLDVINIFSFNWLPLLLIAIGAWLLFGDDIRARMGWDNTPTPRKPLDDYDYDSKPKNDDVV